MDGLFDVAFGGSDFVAVGDKGAILSSRDGGTWNRRSSGPLTRSTEQHLGTAFFVTVGVNPPDYFNPSRPAEIYTSGDGFIVEGILYPDPLRQPAE